jgi:hypothetical protein
MVQRTAAERISRRLIRLFPPDSVFAKPLPQLQEEFPELDLKGLSAAPLALSSPELPGLRFVWPDAASRRSAIQMTIAAREAFSAYPWE